MKAIKEEIFVPFERILKIRKINRFLHRPSNSFISYIGQITQAWICVWSQHTGIKIPRAPNSIKRKQRHSKQDQAGREWG